MVTTPKQMNDKHIYYLNIGSNLGDKHAQVRLAIAALSAGNGGCAVTPMMASEPWGFESANTFVNVGVMLRSDLTPMEMLRWLHDIERQLGSASHRDARGGYVDRVVDIDIMAIDDLVIDTPELTVPHRHLMDRDFFYLLMRQLNPDWTHPLTGDPLPTK